MGLHTVRGVRMSHAYVIKADKPCQYLGSNLHGHVHVEFVAYTCHILKCNYLDPFPNSAVDDPALKTQIDNSLGLVCFLFCEKVYWINTGGLITSYTPSSFSSEMPKCTWLSCLQDAQNQLQTDAVCVLI